MSQPGAAAPQGAPHSTEDQLLDHEYDGIREYDNPLPGWWLVTWYGTVLFAVLYFLNVIPGLGSGKGRIAAYEASVAAAQPQGPTVDPLAGIDDQRLRTLAADPATHQLGVATFTQNCVPCHAADGGGGIGPNLTDGYWLHGGTPAQILHTVSQGVLDKGMPAWSMVLTQDKVIAVAAYITTLAGTHPKAPKAPQGVAAAPGAR